MAAPRPLSFVSASAEGIRQSPFRRQNSTSPATARASTPTSSPNKPSGLSPLKSSASLSPEKSSPFVRRPSQISQAERPTSPFARPTSPFARQPSGLAVPQSPPRRSSPSVEPETPTRAAAKSPCPLDGAHDALKSPTCVDEPALESPKVATVPSQLGLRPSTQRIPTSSTVSTIRPPPQQRINSIVPGPNLGGGFNHIPPPLLRSMRESFEVLDSSNNNFVKSADVSNMLEQMGMDNSASSLKDFFSPNGPAQLNLARYLDMLSAPLNDLSHPEELIAAFEAFDVDDSGQIDVMELRNALLNTAPQPGEDMIRLSEREVDSILGEFSSRRAFGAKGLNVAKGKGEVFRYRDFMAGISGGRGEGGGVEAGEVA